MRVPSIRRGLAAAAILAVTTGSLAACGDDASSKGGSGSTSSTSSSSSTDADAPLDKAGLFQALATAQKKAGSAHLDVAVTGSVALKARGDVRYSSGQPALQMTMTSAVFGNKPIELRVVDGIVYAKIPRLTPDGKFIRVDPKDKSNPLSSQFGSLSSSTDPMKSFEQIKPSVRKVTYVGKQDIDGTATKHYTVTVDGQALAKSMKQKATTRMPKTLTYDVWLDQKNLMRRFAYDAMGLKTVMNITDWGKKVEVQAPPKSAQVDSSALSGTTAGS